MCSETEQAKGQDGLVVEFLRKGLLAAILGLWQLLRGEREKFGKHSPEGWQHFCEIGVWMLLLLVRCQPWSGPILPKNESSKQVVFQKVANK